MNWTDLVQKEPCQYMNWMFDRILVFFFFRAAQKLSLSRKKKSQPGPPSSPSEAPGPLLYTGGFSGALQLSPPAVPPCLLRAGSKVKDTPGMGKVRCHVFTQEALQWFRIQIGWFSGVWNLIALV